MIPSATLARSVMFAMAVVLAAGACGDSENKDKVVPAGVQIVNFEFTPKTLTVTPGTTVTWTNEDTAIHAIKDTSPLATPGSRDLAKGDTFSITYQSPGSYSYICGIHQYMTGTVTVR